MEKKNGPVRALQVLFVMMLSGQILFAFIAFILVKNGLFALAIEATALKVFETVFLAIIFIAYLLAFALSKYQIARARLIDILPQKFTAYRNACILKYALMEGATLTGIVFYLLMAKWSYLIMVAVFIFLFMSQNPVRQRIKIELQVDDADIDVMNELKS
jgi:hypothetical protein